MHKIVGKPIKRVDALSKCTGKTIYADDLFFPEMLFCKIYHSPYPHALIKSIDISRAANLPGVRAVVTGKDLPVLFGILPVSQDEQALCVGKVRYAGDPIAAVAAIDEETALLAVGLINVDYQPLKPIMSIEDALITAEPRINDHGDSGNIHKKVSLEFGDAKKGFQDADEILEDLYFYEGSNHLALEEHAAVAVPEPEGKITLYSSTQTPHYVHKALAKTLQMPAQKIRVIATQNGGGFGGKTDVFSHEIVVVKLALLTGKPVKISLTREEVFYAHRGRHPMLIWMKTGTKKDGLITGMHCKTFLDGGAYGSYGVASLFYSGALQTTTYKIQNYKFEGVRVFTNKPACGPKRGHGTPQPRFALEVHLDRVAEKLSIDPAELRKKHLVPPNFLTANFLKIGSMGLGQCIDKVVEGSGWEQKFRKLPFGKGIGLACGCYLSGAGLPIYWNNMPHSSVMIKLDRSGGVCVYCGQTDVGQGSNSMLAQVVAELLGIDPYDIRLVCADTDLTPVDLGSYSSRVTMMVGNAAIRAAQKACNLLGSAASEKLKIPDTRVSFADGKVFDAENPSTRIAFAEAVQLAEAKFGAISTVGSYTPPPAASQGKYKGSGVGPSPAYSYTACVVQVHVDPETGITKIEKVWIAHDIGKPINPAAVIGQVEGGVYMGLGEALMEEQAFRYRHGGVHKSPSLLEYKSLTSMEMPEVVTYLVEDPDPNGPFGAKEVGQGPLLPVPPAVANAVYDAVGVRINEIPVSPEKILAALKEKAKRGDSIYQKRALPQFTWPDPIKVATPWEEISR